MNKKEYFSKFKKKLDYFMDTQSTLSKYGYYNYGVFIKVVDKEKSFDLDFTVPVPEFIEKIIEPYIQIYYPKFDKIVEKEVYLLPSTIKRMMRENKKIKVADLVHMKEKIIYPITYTIEGIHSRDKHLIINTGFERVLYKYPADIKNIKEFINFCYSTGNLANFVLKECQFVKEYKKDFKINIKYTDAQMVNFFRLNQGKFKEPIVFNEQKQCWEWGRYNIYFSDSGTKKLCMDIIKQGDDL